MGNKYIQDKLDRLNQEKKDLESQLEYAFSDAKIQELEEELTELNHSIREVEKWKINE
jgi:prefoldin subunit 5